MCRFCWTKDNGCLKKSKYYTIKLKAAMLLLRGSCFLLFHICRSVVLRKTSTSWKYCDMEKEIKTWSFCFRRRRDEPQEKSFFQHVCVCVCVWERERERERDRERERKREREREESGSVFARVCAFSYKHKASYITSYTFTAETVWSHFLFTVPKRFFYLSHYAICMTALVSSWFSHCFPSDY